MDNVQHNNFKIKVARDMTFQMIQDSLSYHFQILSSNNERGNIFGKTAEFQ